MLNSSPIPTGLRNKAQGWSAQRTYPGNKVTPRGCGIVRVDSAEGPIHIKLIAESQLPIGVDCLVVTRADI